MASYDSTSNPSSTPSVVPLNESWSYVAALVDCSGSMQLLNPENTAKQLTCLISEQKGSDSEHVDVSIARFSASGTYNMFVQNKPAQDVVVTANDIRPDGSTALFESIARLINDTGKILSEMTNERPGKVIIIILTDGDENASTGEYNGEEGRIRVAEMIKHQQDVYRWRFYFLGANIDAITVGKTLGINANTCINYAPSAIGCTNVMHSASQAVKRYRSVPSSQQDLGFTQVERTTSLAVPNVPVPNLTVPIGAFTPVPVGISSNPPPLVRSFAQGYDFADSIRSSVKRNMMPLFNETDENAQYAINN